MLSARLVAGGVLELHVLEVGRDLEHRLHVAEGGAEDQLVALAGHVAEHALGVGRLGHLLDEAGDDLVAELLLDRLAAVVVREGPAAVADRADVGEGDLQRLGLGRRGGRRGAAAGAAAARRLLPSCRSRPAPRRRPASASRPSLSRERLLRSVMSSPDGMEVRKSVSGHGQRILTSPGKNGLPSEAGMLTRIQVGVARDQHQHDDGGQVRQHGQELARRSARPRPAGGTAASSRRRTGRRRASTRAGRQVAKVVSASAIQPLPAIMPSTHSGV